MEKSAKNQKGTFFNTSLWPGETWFHFDSFTNQDSKFIDTWSELHKYQKPSHQSRTTSPEGAGLLCPCQAPTQGELKPHSLVKLSTAKRARLHADATTQEAAVMHYSDFSKQARAPAVMLFGFYAVVVWFQIIVMYLQVLECEKNQTLVQTAW